MLNKRTNILLDKKIWKGLQTLSEKEKISIGELIRKAIDRVYLKESERESIAKAVESIKSERIRFKKINYTDLISYGRKY